MSYEQYMERLALVNKDHDKRSVWTAIDRPIRPLIYQLHRIGLSTKFSCCGYPYVQDEGEEPKTHHATKAYVQILNPHMYQRRDMGDLNAKVIENFNKLERFVNERYDATKEGWKMFKFHPQVYELCCKNWIPNMYDSEQELSIHDYEPFVIAIYEITKIIENNYTTLIPDDKICIMDGNEHYKALPEWQVMPKLRGRVDETNIEDLQTEKVLVNG